jgi:hypothetical protein
VVPLNFAVVAIFYPWINEINVKNIAQFFDKQKLA